MPAFTNGFEKVLHRALSFANEKQHEYSTLEHFLLALAEDPDVSEALVSLGIDVKALKKVIESYIENDLKEMVIDGLDDSKPTAGFQRVVQRSVIRVQSAGREEVSSLDALLAMFAERESFAASFLEQQGLRRQALVEYMISLRSPDDAATDEYLVGTSPKEKDEAETRIRSIRYVHQRISSEITLNTTACISMSRLAQLEIEKLLEYRPNSDEEKNRKESLIELLRVFSEMFALVANHLIEADRKNQASESIDTAAKNVVSLSEALSTWWNKNHERVVGTALGMPVFVGAVGFLGSFGLAPIPLATATAATATVCFGAGAIENALKIVSATKGKGKDAEE